MDDPLIPELFTVIACCLTILFLWGVVLRTAKEKLRVENHGTLIFLLVLISLPLGGIAIHYCGDIVGLFRGSAGPF